MTIGRINSVGKRKVKYRISFIEDDELRRVVHNTFYGRYAKLIDEMMATSEEDSYSGLVWTLLSEGCRGFDIVHDEWVDTDFEPIAIATMSNDMYLTVSSVFTTYGNALTLDPGFVRDVVSIKGYLEATFDKHREDIMIKFEDICLRVLLVAANDAGLLNDDDERLEFEDLQGLEFVIVLYDGGISFVFLEGEDSRYRVRGR